MNFEAKNFHTFSKLCTAINDKPLTDHVETTRKLYTWGTNLEIMAASSLFKLDIFEATDSLVPGKIKWLKYTPIACEDLIGLEDAGDFNSRRKPWLEIVYSGSSHFDSIKPL